MSSNKRQNITSGDGSGSYIHDYDSATTKEVMAARTSTVDAAFFLPCLRPGMKLLDCGSGLGTITNGLAKVVAPGEVVGVDIEESQIEIANSKASELGLANIRYEIGDVFDLSFADCTFDAVFSNALLTHLKDPIKALKEMYRVLKSGGIAGVSGVDLASYVYAPANPVMDKAFRLYLRFRQHNGGDPYIGRRLREFLREAGFNDIVASASCKIRGTPESIKSSLNTRLTEFAGPKIMKQAIQLGWVDKSFFDGAQAAITEWCENPDSFAVYVVCEAVGCKK